MSDTAKKIVDTATPVVQKAVEVTPDLLDSGANVAIEVMDAASRNKRGLMVAGATALVLATIGTGAYFIMKRRAGKNVTEMTEDEKIVLAEKKPANEK